MPLQVGGVEKPGSNAPISNLSELNDVAGAHRAAGALHRVVQAGDRERVPRLVDVVPDRVRARIGMAHLGRARAALREGDPVLDVGGHHRARRAHDHQDRSGRSGQTSYAKHPTTPPHDTPLPRLWLIEPLRSLFEHPLSLVIRAVPPKNVVAPSRKLEWPRAPGTRHECESVDHQPRNVRGAYDRRPASASKQAGGISNLDLSQRAPSRPLRAVSAGQVEAARSWPRMAPWMCFVVCTST